MRIFTLSAAVALLAATASAATPVGKWTGKITLNLPALPANMPADQKAKAQQMIAKIKASKIMLTVKPDKTYAVKMVGFPGSPPDDSGTWSQTGNAVTMKSKKPNGKTQAVILSKDGKTMTLTAPGGQGNVVFKRG